MKVNRAIVTFGKEKQLCRKNFFICLKRNTLCCENSVCCLVKEWFYYANICGIIDDSLFKENYAIVIYLRNREWTHEF